MTRVYYKEAVGAFVVFDVTRAQTFDAVTKWKTDLDTKVTLADGSPIPAVLLANKVGDGGRAFALSSYITSFLSLSSFSLSNITTTYSTKNY